MTVDLDAACGTSMAFVVKAITGIAIDFYRDVRLRKTNCIYYSLRFIRVRTAAGICAGLCVVTIDDNFGTTATPVLVGTARDNITRQFGHDKHSLHDFEPISDI